MIALISRYLEDRLELVVDVDYFSRLAGAAAVTAMGQGYGVMLVGDPIRPNSSGIALTCDGVIITEPERDDPLVAMLRDAGIPLVTVGDIPGEPQDPRRVIGIDTTRLTTVVLDHLLACGARRIALISGTDPNEWCLTSVECYRRWTSEHGLSCQVAEASEERGDAGGRAAVDEILAAARDANEMPPDAYYCLTAAQARGVCTRLHELGVRVPFDVQVIAGSDSERSRAASPSITAVDLEPELLGRRAVTTMLAILRSEELPTHPTGVGRLAVRDSTLPPLPRHEASTG